MFSFFTIPDQDKSMLFLGQIFGSVAHLFDGFTYGGTTVAAAGTMQSTITVFASMFKIFNLTVLTVGALILVYTTIMGVMATAQEGEFLGKKWHKMWTPLRMVIGIATLVPTSSGYSAIQVIMMWVIIQGIGAADTLWTGVLQYKQVMGSLYAQPVVDTTAVNTNMKNLFKNLVCLATKRAEFPSGNTLTFISNDKLGPIVTLVNANYHCLSSGESDNFCTQDISSLLALNGSSNFYSQQITAAQNSNLSQVIIPFGEQQIGNLNGVCGQMTLSVPSPTSSCDTLASLSDQAQCQLKAATALAQNQVLTTKIIPYLGTLAQTIATTDYVYQMLFAYVNTNAPSLANVNIQIPSILSNWQFGGANSGSGSVNLVSWVTNLNSLPYVPTSAQPDYSSIPPNLGEPLWRLILSPSLQGQNFIDKAVNDYADALTAAVLNVISNTRQLENTTGNSNPNSSFAAGASGGSGGSTQMDLANAQTHGWIYAGAYYYMIAQSNNGLAAGANPTFEVNVPLYTTPQAIQNTYSDRNNYAVADQIMTLMTQSQSQTAAAGSTASAASPGSSLPAPLDSIGATAYNTATSITSTLTQSLTGNGVSTHLDQNSKIIFSVNPLASLQMVGRNIVIAVESFFVAYTLISFFTAIIGNLSPFFLGNGIMNPVGPTFSTISLLLTPLIVGFISSFFVFGATLAVYIPLVPYLIFTVSALGWMIGVIEAMVASPLVALGILSPGGEHEIMGKSAPALGLIFGLFLRPSLMLFGLVAGMLLSGVGVTMVNLGFTMVQGLLTSAPSLLEMVVYLASYVFLIITVVNKCFSLIHVIPERALSWMSIQGQSYGEDQMLGETQKGFQGAAAGAGGMAGAAGAGEYGGFAAGKDAAEARGDHAADEEAVRGGGTIQSKGKK